MFESRDKLQRDVGELVEALRGLGGGRYAAVFDAKQVVSESPAEANGDDAPLRRLVRRSGGPLLRVPAALRSGEEMGDLFSDFPGDEFLLAVVNGRVGILVACADAVRLEAESARLLRALVDRLLRLESGWRLDEQGRGLFFGSPRFDTVVIPRPDAEPMH